MANLDTCTPSTFDGISLFGAEIVQLLAEPVTGYNVNATEIDRLTQPAIVADDISFCNVTVSYTHPNQDDHIIVETWMPATDAWNSRLQSVGGGGLVGGRLPASYATMNGALAEGYIASTTDAGAPVVEPGREIDWALESPGTVKFWNLENFGSKAYGEQAVLVKSLAKTFYGKEPDYSYWNGCSTGGRQGLALAQRYPDAYDGIAAGAPAVSTTKLYGGLPWAQMFMIFNEAFPHRCELEALRLAAIEACDGLDGVKDGVVAEYGLCFDEFDPFSHVGEEIDCGSTDAGEGKMKISGDAAAVANASWHGIETVDGRKMGLGGMGFTHQAPLQFAQTNCTGSGACTGDVNYLILLYYAALVTADPDFNVLDATHEELDQLNYVANEKLSSFLNTDNPDLSSFHGAGGKVIVWHGTADGTVPIGGSDAYTQRVQRQHHQDHEDFYRYYRIPGMAHCTLGRSGQPSTLFAELRGWVENGTAPAELPVKQFAGGGEVHDRILCPYPEVARYDERCGDPSRAECFSCEET